MARVTDPQVLWTDEAMLIAAGGTYVSDSIESNESTGFAGLLVLTSDGSLAITYEISDDGTNWYVPYDTAGNALNVVQAALTEDRWIQFPPQPSRWLRFTLVLTVANSTVSASYRQTQEIFN